VYVDDHVHGVDVHDRDAQLHPSYNVLNDFPNVNELSRHNAYEQQH